MKWDFDPLIHLNALEKIFLPYLESAFIEVSEYYSVAHQMFTTTKTCLFLVWGLERQICHTHLKLVWKYLSSLHRQRCIWSPQDIMGARDHGRPWDHQAHFFAVQFLLMNKANTLIWVYRGSTIGMLCVIWFEMARISCVKAGLISGRALLCTQGSEWDEYFRINLKPKFEMRKDHSNATDQLKY